eukprot:TRINITY_DN97_c0_g1_i1.p1 TRINITY_DN97_c0_g1~~TRINITY_DN97_c0_g1_i1.p1  ORF type:complete len:835 (-),score=148.58 TRINITY_DN97_c0_g1_i1:45-2549(-)
MNGKAVSPAEVFGHQRIKIPVAYQEVGKVNIYEICYQNEYAKNGEGLHIFEDPEDHKHYLYSQFETFLAHKMFPCFDQPNLKAVLRLITISPSEWTIISAEYEEENVEVDSAGEAFKLLDKLGLKKEIIQNFPRESKVNLRIFKETPKISTYLYSVIAGPYEMFKKEKEGNFPPMRIFVRKSLKKFVEKDAEEFFYITKKGIEYYESIFGYKFPYNKYDQIYVPEFNWGGMENVGAITYTELLVFKDAATHQQYMRFANVILHELAHQWFGDLVTMNWWNDLWLNESFATFISNLCMAKAPGLERFRAVWTSFHKYKGWAYREDQEPTTHPITAVIENTEDAENIFDGITYMKGASTLKQLYYLVSHDAFCDGLKEYFQTYQWKNTELKDFIGTMQRALKKRGSAIDLDQWTKQWIFTKGLNELKPKFEVKNKVITEFKVMQEAAVNGDKVCRMHMMDIALYDGDFNTKTIERVLIDAKPETMIEKVKGMPAPVAVLLNVNDYAFCKVLLDPDSIHAFQMNLNKITDNLTRMIVWRSFWDMVRDGNTSSQEFLKLVVVQIPFEKEESIMTGALNYASSAVAWYIPREYQNNEKIPLFDMLMARLKSETSANMKKHLINYLINFACTVDHKKLLVKWLSEGTGVTDAPLSRSNRYSIIKRIYEDSSFSLEEKQKLLAAELENDKSDEGVRAQKHCEASVPTAETKEKYWNIFLDENTKESEHMLFAAMNGFNSWEQQELLKPYIDKYFEVIVGVFEKRSRSYAENFFEILKPNEVNETVLQKFENLKGKVKEEEKTLKKLVLEEIEDTKRILKAQKVYLAGLKKPQLKRIQFTFE